jgi:hypothetical protein
MENDYKKLTNIISEYIEADCFAVKLDNCILFNINDVNLSPRDYIMEQMIRDKLIESPHRYLLSNMFRKNNDFILEIFMSRTTPWKLVVRYSYIREHFFLYKLVSQQYRDGYE